MTLNSCQILFSMKNYLFIVFILLLISCDSESKKENKIETIPVKVNIIRFDKEFAAATVLDIPNLKRKYPQFFPKQFADSVWVNRIQDTLQQELE